MERNQGGFTLVELLIVVMLIAILSAMTAPFLVAARVSANEASAIGSLKAVNAAQATFASTCGRHTYATSFDRLLAGQYLQPDIVDSVKSGFAFAIDDGTGLAGPDDCTGEATRTGYYATATPLSLSTGRRGFATNQEMTVWQGLEGVVPAEPFTRSATVTPIE